MDVCIVRCTFPKFSKVRTITPLVVFPFYLYGGKHLSQQGLAEGPALKTQTHSSAVRHSMYIQYALSLQSAGRLFSPTTLNTY